MPEQLIRFISHPCIANGGKASQEYEGEENRFTRLFALLKKKFGTDFTYYKPSTIIRRIERRMGVRQVHTLEDYLTLLRRDDGEMEALYKDLLIGVTKFFRDPKTFAELKQRVIPALFQAARQRDQRSLRVWVAGCSTGEEAYTLAMLLREQQEADNTDVEIKVFATDIDRKAIESAGIGLYPETIVADMEAGYLSRHFDKRTPGYQVKRSIREMVVFAIQDLAKDPPFTKVDLISCRNLLIYLQPVLQRRIMATFNYALQSQGYLLLGSSETVGEMSDMFQPVDAKNRIYRHTGEGHIPLHEDYLLPRPKDAGLPMEYRSLLLAGETGEPRLHDQLVHYYQAIVRKLAEAALVINQERELVQSFGEVKRYLAVPEGPMTLDVLSLLPRELALAASSGIHRARKSEAAVTYRDLRVKRGKGVEIVTLAIDILKDVRKDGRPGPFFLLHLTRTGTAMQTRSEQALPSSDDLLTQRMSDLEQELQFTRENLQATIEELQTSNEELQATNEELLAANEELQSTNEELQSVNEELNTVNTEYQEKNLELAALNTDIRNLMEATDIGTIFLDRKLCIRKFTPAISRTLNLLPQDVGRPLKDLALEGLGDLVQDAAAVVQQGAPVDRLAVTGEGQVLLRVLPFHNADQQIDGAVITVNPCTQHCLSILMPPAEDNGGRAGRSGKDHGSTDRQPDATCGKRL